MYFFFFFFNDTATTEIYTLSLHDALPISLLRRGRRRPLLGVPELGRACGSSSYRWRSEEHTSELQSHSDLVCRLLLEKKKKGKTGRLVWKTNGGLQGGPTRRQDAVVLMGR